MSTISSRSERDRLTFIFQIPEITAETLQNGEPSLHLICGRKKDVYSPFLTDRLWYMSLPRDMYTYIGTVPLVMGSYGPHRTNLLCSRSSWREQLVSGLLEYSRDIPLRPTHSCWMTSASSELDRDPGSLSQH